MTWRALRGIWLQEEALAAILANGIAPTSPIAAHKPELEYSATPGNKIPPIDCAIPGTWILGPTLVAIILSLYDDTPYPRGEITLPQKNVPLGGGGREDDFGKRKLSLPGEKCGKQMTENKLIFWHKNISKNETCMFVLFNKKIHSN